MPETLTDILGRFVAQASVPESVTGAACERVLDTLGVALAARGSQPGLLVEEVATTAGGVPQAHILGSDGRLPAAAATWVNATLAHALDYDDTQLPSLNHPSGAVVTAALAVAEMVSRSGSDFLEAVAVGDEVSCRVGMACYDPAIRNTSLFENGLHPASICAPFGAAAATARLLGLGAEETAHALAIAASTAAGLLEANRTGGSVKPVQYGWAAHSGVAAAQLAAAGLTGPPTALEGRFGFFRAFAGGRFDSFALTDQLGVRWEMARLFTKPYPTNHFTHVGIEAATRARAEGISAESVEGIELAVAAQCIPTIAEPMEEKARPRTGYHARFSGPFTVAIALVGGGGLGVASGDFTDEVVRSERHLGLAGRVKVVADDRATEMFPHDLVGELRIRCSDGSEWSYRIDAARGGPERPLSHAELGEKFEINVGETLGVGRAGVLAGRIRSLAAARSVADLFD